MNFSDPYGLSACEDDDPCPIYFAGLRFSATTAVGGGGAVGVSTSGGEFGGYASISASAGVDTGYGFEFGRLFSSEDMAGSTVETCQGFGPVSLCGVFSKSQGNERLVGGTFQVGFSATPATATTSFSGTRHGTLSTLFTKLRSFADVMSGSRKCLDDGSCE